MEFKAEVAQFFKDLQDQICKALEQADGQGVFHQDLWERPEGGGGRTRILRGGNIIEKGGVNFSEVDGELPANIAQALKLDVGYFFATGVSIVIHPISPMIPIIHMNVRYFETTNKKGGVPVASWFGGGIDLTPHYIVKEQAAWFHQQLKAACDVHSSDYYPRFKNWADDYFFLPHRDETRGVGGIFFDRLAETEDYSIQDRFAFVQEVGNSFAPIYTRFMQTNNNLNFGERELAWQKLRRGRYVEFNLVFDKGTKFGFDTNGRIESILMSLPATAGWEYNHVPE